MTKKALVLVVENDKALRAEAIEALREAGYDVAETASVVEGLNKIFEMNPDVIIASTDLPPVNGEDACLRIRQASYLPIIVLGNQEELMETLELGADAFIVKPPSKGEVVARVRALLRRKRRYDQPRGDANLGIDSCLPKESDRLGSMEFHLASCLLFNEGRLTGYPQLITDVWGGKEVSLDTLHFHVRSLRQKLANFKILGVRGVGYCLLGGGATR